VNPYELRARAAKVRAVHELLIAKVGAPTTPEQAYALAETLSSCPAATREMLATQAGVNKLGPESWRQLCDAVRASAIARSA
jgi:hypothetical protein